MIPAFETPALRDLCEDPSIASKKLSPEVLQSLQTRLADIRAATTILDLPVGIHQVRGERQELLHFDLGSGMQMIWTVNQPSPPMLCGGDIDWSRITRIRLLTIGVQ